MNQTEYKKYCCIAYVFKLNCLQLRQIMYRTNSLQCHLYDCKFNTQSSNVFIN